MGGLNNKYVFLTVLEAGKPLDKMPNNLVPEKVSLPGVQMAIFSVYFYRDNREITSVLCLLIRALFLS